jgi:hypothetical protein
MIDWLALRNAMPNAPAIASMAASLRRAPDEWFALWPFVPVQVNDRWHIACNDDAAGRGETLLIDAKTGAMSIDGETAAIWGAIDASKPVAIYANGITFARDWAAARAEFYATARKAPGIAQDALQASHAPGVALVGTIDALRDLGALRAAPALTVDNPRLRQPLVDALLKSARLPTVGMMPARLRAVA